MTICPRLRLRPRTASPRSSARRDPGKTDEGPSQAAARSAAATTSEGEAGPARRRSAARPAAKIRKDEENGKTRVFVAPPAPDDPGPESAGQDEPVLPLRPQRA